VNTPMIELYLIHPDFNFNKIKRESILLTDSNTDVVNGVYHTSLGDMSPADIMLIIHKFNSVKMCKHGFEHDPILHKETEKFVNFVQSVKMIKHDVVDQPESFVDHPDTAVGSNNPLLWVFGCSHSHGVGLVENEETYGQIMATKLGRPLKLITKPGSSLHWSLRHLVNSQIKPEDIVVWQITSPLRLSMFNGKHVKEVLLARTNDPYLLEVYNAFQSYFMHLSLVNIGVQYLKKLKVKYILTSVDPHDGSMQHEYLKYPEYCFPSGFAVDRGTDGLHFGPLSHKNIALSLLNRI